MSDGHCGLGAGFAAKGRAACVKMRNSVIAGLTRNLLTCSFQILSLAFGDLRMTVSCIITQPARHLRLGRGPCGLLRPQLVIAVL
jgi:hypothetical protein